MENTDCIKRIYLVGGAVRDKLLNQPIEDKDYVAVGYQQEDFSHLPQVGKSFPVFLQKDGSQIALARKEKKICAGYNGFSIQTQQVSLEEDLKRRDLTINSIAFDEENNKYYDPFNGINDLQNKILRHTSESFCEDPLRVLRIARFRARFGISWKIHPSTKVLIYKMREELKSLEPNRVYKEVESALKFPNTALFFETLFELGVLDIIFPHIYALTTLKEGNLYHLESSVFAHTMEVLRIAESLLETLKTISAESSLEKQTLILKFAALYHDIAKPYCYRNFGNSSGHDKLEYLLPTLDISIPKSIQKPMLQLIKNHIKIYQLDKMCPSKVVKFFESFKKDSLLFHLQFALLIADKEGRIPKDSIASESFKERLMHTFNALNIYSPKTWLESQKSPPKSEAIKAHILQEKIKILDSVFYGK
ncbi:HD domain-containing protein [uncultured Helicobacter sp.]|uniref:HD domain-containing protein n=1 Tax=uncultured Helicobacter sp. TaxID=175537 RepID=UPI00262B536F|nr:HD domain-containing protein [uncultured Helicobacter sp.]